jgi:hypothetical protein
MRKACIYIDRARHIFVCINTHTFVPGLPTCECVLSVYFSGHRAESRLDTLTHAPTYSAEAHPRVCLSWCCLLVRLGVALVDVRLHAVPLPPRSSSPTVAGCRLGGSC